MTDSESSVTTVPILTQISQKSASLSNGTYVSAVDQQASRTHHLTRLLPYGFTLCWIAGLVTSLTCALRRSCGNLNGPAEISTARGTASCRHLGVHELPSSAWSNIHFLTGLAVCLP